MENKRILYGDDNEQLRNSLARALKLRKLEVDLASTPQELVTKARANKYHAVITDLDYTSEGREGYSVLKEIKDLPTLKVLYTGQAGYEFLPEAFESGANYAILNKNQHQLMDLLDKELGGENGN